MRVRRGTWMKCRRLADELRQLPCDEIRSFGRHFRDLVYRAYDWELWAAAYMINHGCSDGGFTDFRSTLISLGRDAYTTALREADALVDYNIERNWASYEGYQYVAQEVYEEKCGPVATQTFEERGRTKRHPREPTGRDWEEWDLHERYPRLAAKYGWEERDWSADKKRKAKLVLDEEKGQRFAQLMLDARIIPACGLIPPPRIALQVIRSGQSPSPVANIKDWEPVDMDEGHYWIAVGCLEKTRISMTSRPDLAGVKVTVDTGAGEVMTYPEWEQSLRNRSLI